MKLIGVGYQTVHDADFTIKRPHGYGDYLLLIMKTESFHVLQNERNILPVDSIILYDETTPQHYGAVGKQYIDDWVHFSMYEDDIIWLKKRKIPFNTKIQLKDTNQISALVRNIAFEFYSANRNKENSSILYLQILLNKLNEIMQPDNIDSLLPFYIQLVNLRTEIYNMPDHIWKIDEMTKMLNLSTSHFQHMYKKLFGISVINDVISSRISHSKKLLTGTNFPIKKIAALCGYEYDVYYMRQFKRRTGITPKEYRRIERENNK